ncbi:pyruvate dehydrogenase E2 component (dihydrolipoamide acetyltransferase) [Actinoplanes octamycinicus]|uniref:Dihydrolipoamide acetyltransferase component of pyruvate dehydrogenase complex n=1 Tax=Actinoplanes octamycinicus TaxID=135948 RepID=A0A7W7GTZ0_9ACTN|nr:dihydrolipoamide acetyltransferase family protein [Actinoplanes octamycinicus]MBB4738207.1 pyruvate dehydrogenase E2 component (dihydrolipoamide acetyltransferase) [Actinoplanes octamycinicus]GIE59234.1 dihydrolipoamide acetyltransferase component of pyruvate dehydrogenase complex [Actinoplanes octamycinicus]
MSRIKEFNLPDLGEGLTEGEILAWLVKVGDTIELNQPIVEVETAKAAVEIPAKWAGVVTKIFHEAGVTVEVGQPIISIDTEPGAGELPEPSAESLAAVSIAPSEGAIEPGMVGSPAPAAPGVGRTPVLVGYGVREASAKRRPRVSTPAAAARAVTAPAATPAPAVTPAPAPAVPPAAPVRSGPVLAKPPVRKLARDLGVDLATIAGTGPLGSVTRDDVHQAAEGARKPAPVAAAVPTAVFDASREQRIPVKGVRKLTAENMVASAFTAPHVTEFLTVDVTRSMKALDKLKTRPEFADLRISPLLLVAKAVLLAVKRHPMVNSSWSAATGEIVVKEYVNLGIAAATERGLIVPNVKDAGRLSLVELAEALNALVRTAKSGKTPPADMAHGTLSITNVGVFGVDTGTPILPPGESAILAFGAIRPTPWVHKGKIKVRQVTTLGLSFDHRIIDGELGSKFLRDIGAFLTDPEAAILAWT